MPKVSKLLPVLTDAQKKVIDDNYMKIDLQALTRLVFNNQALTRRNVECKSIKIYLAAKGKGVTPDRVRSLELTQANKDYIRMSFGDSSPVEMARVLWNNDSLMPSSREVQVVANFCRTLDPNYRRDEEMAEGDYQPPKSITQLIYKVNKFAIQSRENGRPVYEQGKLSNQDEKQLRYLDMYMTIPLFLSEANKFTRKTDRELYEANFIAHMWNKPEMMTEDVFQYIALCSEIVKKGSIERMAQRLEDRINATLDTDEHFKMAEIELLNSVREKANVSMKKIADLQKTLVDDRAKRDSERIQASASMHNLVDAWKKQDERRKLIQASEKLKKLELKDEVDRLSTMDAIKAEFFGLSAEDILR